MQSIVQFRLVIGLYCILLFDKTIIFQIHHLRIFLSSKLFSLGGQICALFQLSLSAAAFISSTQRLSFYSIKAVNTPLFCRMIRLESASKKKKTEKNQTKNTSSASSFTRIINQEEEVHSVVPLKYQTFFEI